MREKRLSNARGRGLCKANAGHAPRGMVSRGPEALLRRYSRGVTPLARALLPEKGASKIYIAISYSGQNVWLFRKIPCDTMSVDLDIDLQMYYTSYVLHSTSRWFRLRKLRSIDSTFIQYCPPALILHWPMLWPWCHDSRIHWTLQSNGSNVPALT